MSAPENTHSAIRFLPTPMIHSELSMQLQRATTGDRHHDRFNHVGVTTRMGSERLTYWIDKTHIPLARRGQSFSIRHCSTGNSARYYAFEVQLNRLWPNGEVRNLLWWVGLVDAHQGTFWVSKRYEVVRATRAFDKGEQLWFSSIALSGLFGMPAF